MVFAYKGIDEFDVSFYVAHHHDLCGMSAEQAYLHYRDHGQGEGRPGLPGATRETLPLQRHSNDRLLEIGPFGNPFLVGPNVRYADCFSTEELRMRAQNIPGMQSASCPQIDYNLSRMSLHDVPDRFSAAFSSHCVEHQPDLIGHFNEVASILEPGAPYFLVVPDKRYCFDHFRPLSTMIEVLAPQSTGEEFIQQKLFSKICC